jgi:hypothetical protein
VAAYLARPLEMNRVSDMISEIEDLIAIEDKITYQEEATETFIKIPK